MPGSDLRFEISQSVPSFHFSFNRVSYWPSLVLQADSKKLASSPRSKACLRRSAKRRLGDEAAARRRWADTGEDPDQRGQRLDPGLHSPSGRLCQESARSHCGRHRRSGRARRSGITMLRQPGALSFACTSQGSWLLLNKACKAYLEPLRTYLFRPSLL